MFLQVILVACVSVCPRGAHSATLKAFNPRERPESAASLSMRLKNIRACVWVDGVCV